MINLLVAVAIALITWVVLMVIKEGLSLGFMIKRKGSSTTAPASREPYGGKDDHSANTTGE